VVELKKCEPMVPGLASGAASAQFKPGNHVFRYFRRQILTFRSDIWRANIIYGAYDLVRMSVVAWRHHSAETTTREANTYLMRAQVRSGSAVPPNPSAAPATSREANTYLMRAQVRSESAAAPNPSVETKATIP